MTARRILGIGGALVDALLPVDDAFLKAHVPGAKGGMEMVSRADQDRWIAASGRTPARASGGAAGNTVMALGHLGVPAALLSKVGADADGEFYRSRLPGPDGAECLFTSSSGEGTGRCLAMVTPDGERTMRTALGASAELTLQDVEKVDFRHFGMVYAEGYQLFNPGLVQTALRRAKDSGCVTALDAASFEVMRAFREPVLELLGSSVDLFFANEEEAAELTGPGKSAEAMALELGKLCRVAAVKCGPRGSCIVRNGVLTTVEITPVKALDTTAAGDSWAAGYLYGYCRDLPDGLCGRIASVLSAEIVQVYGAELPEMVWKRLIRTIQELEKNGIQG